MSEVTALKISIIAENSGGQVRQKPCGLRTVASKDLKGPIKKASLTHTTELFEVNCYGGKNGKSKNQN